jgi:hypothetical protein
LDVDVGCCVVVVDVAVFCIVVFAAWAGVVV